MKLTEREKEILQIVREHPLISQKQLAEQLKIKRSSVAVHLRNLTGKGHIAGRGYIIRDEPYICILGGAILDIVGYPSQALIEAEANIGEVRMSMGGVGRNIAEILVKLGQNVKLISVFGSDIQAEQMLDHCRKVGIETGDSLFLSDGTSSVHMAIMDKHNDMQLGLSAIDIFSKMSISFIRKKSEVLKNAQLVIIDTNMSKTIIEYSLNKLAHSKTLVDTVSGMTALRIADVLDKIYCLKVNTLEAEILVDRKIVSENDCEQASKELCDRGVKRVYITRGAKGIHYREGDFSGFCPAPEVEVVNTNGSGDAFSTGLALGMLADSGPLACAEYGLRLAAIALSSKETVHPDIGQSITSIPKSRNG